MSRSEVPIKCLSVRQPFAWLLVNGYKDVENRTQWTNHRGPLLIHAGLQMYPHWDKNKANAIRFLMDCQKSDPRHRFFRREGMPWPDLPDSFEMGGIVGMVDLHNCTWSTVSLWFTGPVGYEVRNGRPLPFIPCKGQQGFWNPSPEMQEQLRGYL